MKIGILTFHRATNYGAILQAYGLVEYLKLIGHDVKIIDYKPKGMGQLYAPICFLSPIKVFKRLVLNILMLPSLKKRATKRKMFWNYTENILPLSNMVLNDKDLSELDAYIVGSDQVWNVLFTGGVDRYYWGMFNRKNAKLLSYAASAAENMQESFVSNNNAELLNNFDSISVREDELRDFLKEKLPTKEIFKVLDPTLLAGRDVFEKLVGNEIPYQDPYILIYQVIRSKDSLIQQYAKVIAQKYNTNIVEVKKSKIYLYKDGRAVAQHDLVNPTTFVALFKHAKYVLTTSFHGTAFSLLFNRPFNVVSVSSEVDSRAKDILKQLDLDERLISLPKEFRDLALNWDIINDKLKQLREPSREFINNALK